MDKEKLKKLLEEDPKEKYFKEEILEAYDFASETSSSDDMDDLNMLCGILD